MLATLISVLTIGVAPNAAQLDNSILYGEWKSQTIGYAFFRFCRDGSYFEFQEGLDPKTGTRSYRAEAKGNYQLFVRELTLFQHERTLTAYYPDGSVKMVQNFGHWQRLIFLLFPKDEAHMQVTDTDGSKRFFERTVKFDRN